MHCNPTDSRKLPPEQSGATSECTLSEQPPWCSGIIAQATVSVGDSNSLQLSNRVITRRPFIIAACIVTQRTAFRREFVCFESNLPQYEDLHALAEAERTPAGYMADFRASNERYRAKARVTTPRVYPQGSHTPRGEGSTTQTSQQALDCAF